MSSTLHRKGLGSKLPESAWDQAGLLSKYSMYFMHPLLRKGYAGKLALSDLGAPPKVDQSRPLGLALQHHFNRGLLSRRGPSLARALLKAFGPQLILISVLDLLSKCLAFPMQTIALGWLIRDTTIYLQFSQRQEATANSTDTLTANGGDLPTSNVTLAPPPESQPTATTSPVPVQVQTLTESEMYWWIVYDGALIVLFTCLSITLSHPFYLQTYHIGMKCRIAACHLIYKKSLRLSQSAMSETTVGQMVNLLSNDVNRFDQAAQLMPYLIVAPLQAALVIALLSISYLGFYPTLASLVAVLVYVIVQTAMGRGFSKFRARTAKRTDERVRQINEIILAMKIIKMYAWEEPYKKMVHEARRREILTIGVSSILKAINQTLFFVSSKIIVFVALITYVLMGNSFNPEIVFVSIGLANLIRIQLTLFFPNAVAYCAETLISCQRISRFLTLPEIDTSSSAYKASQDGFGCKYAVQLSRVYASWAAKDQDLVASADARFAVLRNLSLAIRPHDLVLVVGRVGSGKSSVLMSILGELPLASGRLEVNGRLSFASQEAWIYSGTVRDNILFGKRYESARYREVIRVCSLERDLEILVDGDATMVGERGVSLSGGQKARVNLARALYREADIYVLDDPLSAVDAPVARHIFNESLRTFLRKKTVILATHQLQFLCHATKVLIMDRHQLAVFGTLQEVIQSEAFAAVNYSKEAFEEASTTATEADADAGEGVARATRPRQRRRSTGRRAPFARAASVQSASERGRAGEEQEQEERARAREEEGELEEALEEVRPLVAGGSSRPGSRASEQSAKQLLQSVSLDSGGSAGTGRRRSDAPSDSDDSRRAHSLSMSASGRPLRAAHKSSRRPRIGAAGSERHHQASAGETLRAVSVDCSTYGYYVRAASGPLMLVWFLLTNVAAQGLYQFTDYFLSLWTDSVQRKEWQGPGAFVPQTYVDRLALGEISGLYAILVLLCIVSTFCRSATYFAGTLRASINIHRRLFESVVHAPMSFFDFSPIGILLNRLSRDMGFVDETLPATLIEIVVIFVNIIGIIVLAVLIDYTNLISSAILVLLALAVRNYGAHSITKLKQMEGITRSPIFSHLSTSLSGLATIRAFRVQEEFLRLFDSIQDTHTSAWFYYLCAGRWLSVSMDWLCLLFISAVVSFLLAFSLSSTNASLVGLLVSQTIIIPGPFQWGMRQLVEAESQMTSVQRIREFSHLEPEGATEPGDGAVSGANEHEDEATLARVQAIRPDAQDADEDDYVGGHGGHRFDGGPAEGEIKFVKLTLRYFADEPPVLDTLQLTIRPREKVAIVGRTGAGKSSIVSALFRLYPFQGRIEIDGTDTKRLTLAALRRSISIIPQDPILFGASLRKNLDPFNEYSDRQLWDAIEAVRLRPLFAQFAQGLDYTINEGGSNFSVGQRQLICLARAIVRRNNILVLDEATANVDPETDVFIQRTIAQQFAHCTVITIAHRLITIVDCDRVLVLERGQVRQFDAPHQLLKDSEGLFARMVESSGQHAVRLRKLIEEAHERRSAR